MQYTLVLAALVTLATAQLNLPDCALTCFAAAIESTTCAVDDSMCQCTTGKAQIQDELLGVVQESNKVCSAALSSVGSTYTAATVGLQACATGNAASTPTGSAASGSMTGTASGSQISATGTMTGTASGSGSASSTASAAQQTGSSAAGMNMAHGLEAVLGLAGLAAFVL
ncbi:SWI/SNF and RSC complex subunit Ssr1 [Elasticomyces elasticus]|nr:SWI/SNF and RSC complex subunit Ssr1 [Elasticomyces elasticus]KAK3668435.1 SWI/SNF and RSC complex subunit Ssr1 [Elasticomyces elasticus]KAK5753673.1 SWI/SNF and RSC complex subunit Ssr1 [Elasticomyces elasticus]